jgi:hypothetical protein
MMNSLSPDVLELLNGGSERRRRFGSGSSCSSTSSGGFIPYATYVRKSQVGQCTPKVFAGTDLKYLLPAGKSFLKTILKKLEIRWKIIFHGKKLRKIVCLSQFYEIRGEAVSYLLKWIFYFG